MEHDTRKPGGQTMALNTGLGFQNENSILIAEGDSFTIQVIRDPKTNKHWYNMYYPLGASLLSHKAMRVTLLWQSIDHWRILHKRVIN